MDQNDKLALELLRKYENLLAKRKAERDDDWQFIAQYFLPQDSNITTQKTESVSGWTDQIFDTTAIHAAEVLAAGLFNWWTPQNQPWAEYDVPDELTVDGSENDDAIQWLGEAADKAMAELGRSNFYPVKATGDLGLSVFATDCIVVDESDTGNELFNFVHCKVGTYVIDENYKGYVDVLMREIDMTYRQVKQKFNKPGDDIPEKMADQAKGTTGNNKKFKILHCIFPREDSDRLPNRKDGANKPVASVFVALEFKKTIRVSGYDENPILCRRFKKWVTQYGYGPSYLALPDARQVNYVQQYMDALAELHAYPRVLIPSNLEGDVDLRAGGSTTFDENMPAAMPKEWASVGDYKLGIEMQEGRRQAIRDAFYVDAFKLLNSPPLLDKDMTAFEISQRQAEQLQNITAVDARQIVEFINPLMNRVFGIMFRAGKLGRPPERLMQPAGPTAKALVLPKVVVTSRFNDALRALKNRGTDETFRFALQVHEANPQAGIMDVFELDDVIRGYARNSGMAPDEIRKTKGPNSVQSIRAARAAVLQQQRQAQLAAELGKAGRGLGGSPQFMQDAVQDQMEQAQDKQRKTA